MPRQLWQPFGSPITRGVLVGLALLTPADVHHGRAPQRIADRQRVIDDFYRQHPERFTRPPRPPQLPDAVWINKPPDEPATT